MLEKYYPYEYARNVFVIDYKKLYEQGYRGLIFDIDNTLVHHGEPSTERVDKLFAYLKRLGFKTLLLTNNDDERVQLFIKNIDTEYICDADKPSPKAYLAAIERLGLPKEKCVSLGDQMFIDVIGANGVGLPNILVHYVEVPGEKWLGFKRYLEMAILFIYRRRKKYTHRLGNIIKRGKRK